MAAQTAVQKGVKPGPFSIKGAVHVTVSRDHTQERRKPGQSGQMSLEDAGQEPGSTQPND